MNGHFSEKNEYVTFYTCLLMLNEMENPFLDQLMQKIESKFLFIFSWLKYQNTKMTDFLLIYNMTCLFLI